MMGENGPISHVSRMLGAAASLGESASTAAAAGITASSSLAATITEAAVSAATETMSISQGAWRGVDLLNLSLRQVHGRYAGEDGDLIADWLMTPAAAQVAALPVQIRSTLAATARAVSVSLPHVQAKHDHITVNQSYLAYTAEARLLPSGYVVLQFATWEANFSLQWVNPLWGFLDFAMDAESLQVTATLSTLFNSTPMSNLTWANLDDTQLATGILPQIYSARARRWLRRLYYMFKGLWSWFFIPPWEWYF
jgi:hypothetical protein